MDSEFVFFGAMFLAFIGLVIVMPILAFTRAREASARVIQLTAQLGALHHRLEQLERNRPLASAATVAEPTAPPLPVAVIDAPQPAPVGIEPAPPVAPAPESVRLGKVWTPPVVRPPVAKKPARSRAEWEALVGGQVLNRVGALALILGVGYFLKYAFDNEWIGPAMRVLIGVIVGTGLQVGGWVFHRRKLPIFAQGLTGAGIAVLYLCVYAAFNFYGLISQPVAFGLMSAVTVLAFAQAISTDSLAVSLLGWAGGVLTPFMLSTGQVNDVGLFGYLGLFSLGMIAVSIWQQGRTADGERWTVLEPLTLLADLVILASWYDTVYRVSQPATAALVFLLAVWAMVFAADLRRSLRPAPTNLDPRWILLRHATAVVNAGAVLLGIVALMTGDRTRAAAFVGLGLVYAGSWWTLDRRGAGQVAVTRASWSAVAFVVTAIAFGLDGDWITGGWTVLAVALIAAGLRFNRDAIWQAGLAVLGLTLIRLVVDPVTWVFNPIEQFRPVLNPRALTVAVVAAGCAASAALFGRWGRDKLAQNTLAPLLNIGWIALLFILVTVETNDTFRRRMIGLDPGELRQTLEFLRPLMVTVFWLMLGLPLIRWGRDRSRPVFAALGLGLIGLAAVVAVGWGWDYDPVLTFVPVVNPRALLFTLVAVALGLAAAWQRPGLVRSVLIGATIFVGFALVTVETVDAFDVPLQPLEQQSYVPEVTGTFSGDTFSVQTDSVQTDPGDDALEIGRQQAIEHLRNGRQLALSGVWLGYGALLLVLGWWRRSQVLRLIALGMVGLVIVKVALIDLSFLSTPYRIICFIGLALFLLAVSYLYQRYPQLFLDDAGPTVGPTDAPPELSPDAAPASPTSSPDEPT